MGLLLPQVRCQIPVNLTIEDVHITQVTVSDTDIWRIQHDCKTYPLRKTRVKCLLSQHIDTCGSPDDTYIENQTLSTSTSYTRLTESKWGCCCCCTVNGVNYQVHSVGDNQLVPTWLGSQTWHGQPSLVFFEPAVFYRSLHGIPSELEHLQDSSHRPRVPWRCRIVM